MESPHRSRPRLAQRLILASVAAFAGCGGFDDALTVATAWPASERKAFATAYQEWAARNPEAPREIKWITVAPSDELASLALRSSPPDLILGASAAELESLDRQGRLKGAEGAAPPWVVARRVPLGLMVRPSSGSRGTTSHAEGSAPEARRRSFAFDDPRRDPVALEWARAVLSETTWEEGYGRLIRDAAGPLPPGRNPGASLAAVERGEADSAPAHEPLGGLPGDGIRAVPGAPVFLPVDGWPEWRVAAAAVQAARHAEAASRFLADQVEAGAMSRPENAPGRLGEADALLADLLGAVLVEAREELAAAWSALDRAGRPERAEAWMTQPPPWPPASVQKLLDRETNAMAMIETLAAQVTPDAGARAWLLRSWIAPARPVDGVFLAELATAVNGRLASEPRFRVWLRGEWTAWARQRFRRVARAAESPLAAQTSETAS